MPGLDSIAAGHAVIFEVAGRHCAVDLHNIANVVPLQGATPIPGAPLSVYGVTSFEERPTLVCDLAVLFGFGTTTPVPRTCVLFMRATQNSATFGLLADAVVGVLEGMERVAANLARCPIPGEFVRLMLRSDLGDVPLLDIVSVYRCLAGDPQAGEVASC